MIPFFKSLGETVYHLVVVDMIQPLFNWNQRVDNAVTAIQANQSGATMGYDPETGGVYTMDGFDGVGSQAWQDNFSDPIAF